MPLYAQHAQTELSPQQFDTVAQMGRGLVLGGQPRAGPQPPNFGVPFYACTLRRRTTKFDAITYVGRGLVFRGLQRPISRGGAPAFPNFGGSFLFMRTPVVAELANFTW